MNCDGETVLEYMIAAEHSAAEIVLSARGVKTENKTSSRDVVTQYDKRVQQLLVERLSEKVPGAAFFCEENFLQDREKSTDEMPEISGNLESGLILLQ